MKRKNRQFGEKLSPGQPFRVSIILRQAARVAKNKRTKRKGRTQTQAKRQKQTNKSSQDRGKHFLIKRKSSKKRDGRKTKRWKMRGKSGKSDQGRGVQRKKTKKRNGRAVKVRRGKEQDINRRRRRTKRMKTRSSIKGKGRSSSTIWEMKVRPRQHEKRALQMRSLRPKRRRKEQSRRRQSRGRKNEDSSEDTQQHCTGALIKENWIITAANCFDVSQTFFPQVLPSKKRNKLNKITQIFCPQLKICC